ncbi:MAG: 4-hydroxybenzoate octaprenyltransferase [Chromatiales bacterium]|jgi:4-hydroxybenzoate polyprenyltransferase|nr:4-hydroxybenzoate octaprenyltransferase [Chromatiales bacterium]
MARGSDGSAAGLPNRLRAYGRLIRLDRPIGTLLLLWPTLWALWIASSGRPDPEVFVVFVAGVFLMRSAGCAINDFADRDFDPHVERTRSRPLASGVIAPVEALLVAASLALAAFLLVLRLNALTIGLSLIGGFMAASYPFLKRFTSLPQFYLGAAFGWAVPMAFAAQTNTVPATAWLLFVAVILWAVAYDTMYAMVDREDDLRIGVRSTAILFGRADRLAVAVAQAGTLLALLQVGRIEQLGGWYQGALLVAASMSIWQQILIRDRQPERCFRAFLNNNALGMTVFIGVLLDYTFRSA